MGYPQFRAGMQSITHLYCSGPGFGEAAHGKLVSLKAFSVFELFHITCE